MIDGTIPDFTNSELATVREAVKQRYRKDIDVQLADSEVKLDPNSDAPSWAPTAYWAECGVNFVVLKLGAGKYRAMFFYQPDEQFGTGRPDYDDLKECVTILLQVQADHEKESAGVSSGKTGKDLI